MLFLYTNLFLYVIVCITLLTISVKTEYIFSEYDFCNVNESKAAYFIIRDILDFFGLDKNKSHSEKCLILEDNLIKYYFQYNILERENKNSYNIFKCTECEKKFKNRAFLNLHYKIFHFSKSKSYSDYYCPADICRFLNCDRYKYYLSIPFPDNTRDKNTNKQPKEKYQECNRELIGFYRKSCMNLISDCFDVQNEEQLENYFEFYQNFCMKIECGRDSLNPQYNYLYDLQREGGVWDAIRLILLYIISIFAFIYLLIIWISKYS